MKIVFLCGSLEPGRDGVGDYVSRLATYLESRGHIVLIIALYDSWISKKIANNGSARFKDAIRNKIEKVELLELLSQFKPDWISLHFVPYAFEKKGLCWRLIGLLNEIHEIAKLEIMVHELWIGPYIGAPWRHRFIGWIQRWIISIILKKADCVHTHALAYRKLLKDIDIDAVLLPLFSNLTVANDDFGSAFYALCKSKNLEINANNRNDFWVWGILGSLHRSWSPDSWLNWVAREAKKINKKVLVIGLAHMRDGASLFNKLIKKKPNGIIFIKTEFLKSEILSQIIRCLDAAVATTPLTLIDKSSSFAAMQAHGIPVLINCDTLHIPAVSRMSVPDGAYFLNDNLESKQLLKRPPSDVLSGTGDQFLKNLESLVSK